MVSSLSTTDKKQHKVAALVTFFSLLGLHISFFAFAAVMELEVSHKVIYAVISLVGQGLVSLAVWNERDDDHIDEDEEQGSATFVAPLLMQGTVPLLNVWDGGSDYADEEESTAAAEGTEEV